MSKPTKRAPASADEPSVDARLARLLEAPFLDRIVPHLPPAALHRLIRDRGLDACGEVITSATPRQLALLMDLDLWRQSQPGQDHHFDADRFGELLETLASTGTSAAARTLAALDPDLVAAGLSRYVRVFDPGIFEPVAQSDDEMPERYESMREGDLVQPAPSLPELTGSDLEYEVGGYVVRGRRSDAWDAVVTLLVALDAESPSRFHAVMQRCRRLSNSRPEADGLHDLQLAPEQHLHAVTLDRERRRAGQGYATPADARAFLQMARQQREAHVSAPGVNPIVTAYFRAAADTGDPDQLDERCTSGPSETLVPAHVPAVTDSLDPHALVVEAFELLSEAGMMPDRPRALLGPADGEPQDGRLASVRRFMAHLQTIDDTAAITCGRELAFLANTLLEGCSLQDRPFTPEEASAAAAAVCNLGLECWPGKTAADGLSYPHDLVAAFEAGWSVLHHDVSSYVAQQLMVILEGMEVGDREIEREVRSFCRRLTRHHQAGTPWLARDAAEVLAMLDVSAWTGVIGLLAEYPVVPTALRAVLEGRTTAVSPLEFEFISTRGQLEDIRAFMGRLPGVLAA